jgi:hypothetical protein
MIQLGKLFSLRSEAVQSTLIILEFSFVKVMVWPSMNLLQREFLNLQPLCQRKLLRRNLRHSRENRRPVGPGRLHLFEVQFPASSELRLVWNAN